MSVYERIARALIRLNESKHRWAVAQEEVERHTSELRAACEALEFESADEEGAALLVQPAPVGHDERTS